ncbi:hypothetical protein BG004_003144 [Podila humilis]|nr:hypothetical protein BG004_003144 [Podila humilis]
MAQPSTAMIVSMDDFEDNHSSTAPLLLPRSTPLDLLELLERILYLVPPAQLDSIRLVSRLWNQASFRPRWKYPFLARRGMTKFGPRFRKYGHVVLELDFTESYLYSSRALDDVQFLITHCPNVRALALPIGCLTYDGVARLIRYYAALKQLHTLKLDMTNHSEEPHMGTITQITSLRCLSIKFSTRSSRRPMDFDYEELFVACLHLQDLTLVPAPGFKATSRNLVNPPGGATTSTPTIQNQQATASHGFQALLQQIVNQSNTVPKVNKAKWPTAETLKVFEEYRPKLRRLHLDNVWFLDTDIKTLSMACPDIEDLRISNFGWGPGVVGCSFGAILESWPRIRRVEVDGHRIGLASDDHQSANSDNNSTIANTAATSTKTAILMPLTKNVTPVNSNMISSLSIIRISSISTDDLVAIVDIVSPSLNHLNLEGCQKVNDNVVRHVLMTCTRLLELSAAELNLTMALFEDKDSSDLYDDMLKERMEALRLGNNDNSNNSYNKNDDNDNDINSIQKILTAVDTIDGSAMSGGRCSSHQTDIHSTQQQQQQQQQHHHLSTVQREWACARTLRTLNLSWKHHDGRPMFVPVHYGRDDYIQARKHWERLSKNLDQRQWPRCCDPNRKDRSNEEHDVKAHALWMQLQRAYSMPVNVFLPMFRKPWARSSVYHRLRQLERLEVLSLQGWAIPWNAIELYELILLPKVVHVPAGEIVPRDLEEIDLTPDRIIAQSEHISQLYKIPVVPPSSTLSSSLEFKVWAPAVRGLAFLQHLNIRCHERHFYSLEEIQALNNSTPSSSSRSQQAAPFPSQPPPPPLVKHFNAINFSTRLQEQKHEAQVNSDSHMFSFLGMLMKLCPRFETVHVRPSRTNDRGVVILLGFTARLAKQKSRIQDNIAEDKPETTLSESASMSFADIEILPRIPVVCSPRNESATRPW